VAAAIAVALARRGHAVHLSTTDPAAHIAAAVGAGIAGLSVGRIDPSAEVARIRGVLARRQGLDAAVLVEEDLRSPCTEEIAVFRAFAQAVDAGRDGFVVLDTAPTGHTLLLLDAAAAYHREVLRTRGEMPPSVAQLLPRLRDPAYTRILIVTLPEATPVHEAGAYKPTCPSRHRPMPVADQKRASGTADRNYAARAVRAPFIRRVAAAAVPHVALIPWRAQAPVRRRPGNWSYRRKPPIQPSGNTMADTKNAVSLRRKAARSPSAWPHWPAPLAEEVRNPAADPGAEAARWPPRRRSKLVAMPAGRRRRRHRSGSLVESATAMPNPSIPASARTAVSFKTPTGQLAERAGRQPGGIRAIAGVGSGIPQPPAVSSASDFGRARRRERRALCRS
jgi:hypothetical protein